MMRSAQQVARAHKLGTPKYGQPHPGHRGYVWFIAKESGDYLEWSWHPTSNGCWRRRSSIPLFDDRKIVAIA
jgi:hypothetical protein